MADDDAEVTVSEELNEQSGWSEPIPDDISLFPGEDKPDKPPAEKPKAKAAPKKEAKAKPEKPAEKEKAPAKPPADDKKPEVEAKPPEPEPAKEPETPPEPAVPDSLKKIQRDIEERDRAVSERERALKDADRWRRTAEEHEQLVQRLRADPLSALQAVGADLPRVLEEKLGLAEPQSREEQLMQRLERLEREREQERTQAVEREQQARIEAAHRNVLERYSGVVQHAAKGDLAESPHPHLATFQDQGQNVMFAQASTYAKRTGRWLPDDEAARRAEEQLASEVEDVLAKARKMPQYQHWFVSQPTNGERQDADLAATRQSPPGKTMSNRDTTTPPPAGKTDLIGADEDVVLAAGLAEYYAKSQRE